MVLSNDIQRESTSLRNSLREISKDSLLNGDDSEALQKLVKEKDSISNASQLELKGVLRDTLKRGFNVRNKKDRLALDHVLVLAGFSEGILSVIPEGIQNSPEGYIVKLNSEYVSTKGSTGQQLFVYKIDTSWHNRRDNDVVGYIDQEAGTWTDFTWNIYTRDDDMGGNNKVDRMQLAQDENLGGPVDIAEGDYISGASLIDTSEEGDSPRGGVAGVQVAERIDPNDEVRNDAVSGNNQEDDYEYDTQSDPKWEKVVSQEIDRRWAEEQEYVGEGAVETDYIEARDPEEEAGEAENFTFEALKSDSDVLKAFQKKYGLEPMFQEDIEAIDFNGNTYIGARKNLKEILIGMDGNILFSDRGFDVISPHFNVEYGGSAYIQVKKAGAEFLISMDGKSEIFESEGLGYISLSTPIIHNNDYYYEVGKGGNYYLMNLEGDALLDGKELERINSSIQLELNGDTYILIEDTKEVYLATPDHNKTIFEGRGFGYASRTNIIDYEGGKYLKVYDKKLNETIYANIDEEDDTVLVDDGEGGFKPYVDAKAVKSDIPLVTQEPGEELLNPRPILDTPIINEYTSNVPDILKTPSVLSEVHGVEDSVEGTSYSSQREPEETNGYTVEGLRKDREMQTEFIKRFNLQGLFPNVVKYFRENPYFQAREFQNGNKGLIEIFINLQGERLLKELGLDSIDTNKVKKIGEKEYYFATRRRESFYVSLDGDIYSEKTDKENISPDTKGHKPENKKSEEKKGIPTLDSIRGDYEAEQEFFRKFGLVYMNYEDTKTDAEGVPYYATSILSDGNSGVLQDVHMNLAGDILGNSGSSAGGVIKSIRGIGDTVGGVEGETIPPENEAILVKETGETGSEKRDNIIVTIINYLNLKGPEQEAVSNIEGIDPREISKNQLIEFFEKLPSNFVLSSKATKTPEGKQVAFMLQSTIALLMPENKMGAIDGLWGTKSKAVLKELQEAVLGMDPNDADNSKRPDGVFGPNTKDFLIATLRGRDIQDSLKLQTRYDIYRTRAENLTGAELKLLNGIAGSEVGLNGSYDTPYGKGLTPNKPFTQMTIAEVMQYQKESVAYQEVEKKAGRQDEVISGATGRYQITQGTLKALVEKFDVDLNQKFDKTMQDTFAIMLLEGRGYSKFLNGEITREEFLLQVSQEWASWPKDLSGKSYYEKDGTNKAHISYTNAISILDSLKASA